MNEKKYNTIYIGIILVGLFTLIVSSSYAYFTAITDLGNANALNFSTITPSAPTFSSYSSKNLTLNVNAGDMLEASTTPVKSSEGELIVTLAAPNAGSTVHCTYDVVLETSSKYKPSNTLPLTGYTGYNYEISLKGERATTGDTSGHTYVSKALSETSFGNYTLNANETNAKTTTIISGAEIYSKSTTATKTTWTFTMNFYSLPVSQNSIFGQNISAKVYVANVVC